MKNFFKYFFAVLLGSLLTALIIVFFFMSFMGIIASKSKKPFTAEPNSVYTIRLDKPIEERAPESFFDYINISPEARSANLGLNDILKNIEKARKEFNIKGIFLDLSVIQGGMATVAEIRRALEEFKTSGKFIVAYGDLFDKKAYYLASVADEVYMNPAGMMEFTGLKSEILFFKGTFEKLGIQPKVFRVGKYKSFGEKYDGQKLSDENREQIMAYVSGTWKLMLQEISKSRQISVKKLDQIASQMETITPQKILNTQLIDGLKYKDEVIEIIKERCGALKIKLVSHVQMKKLEERREYRGFIKEKIAVIYAWGTVQTGSGNEGTIGADRISKALRLAREDSSVKAVVLRVNSGGGSALASEIIWREVDLTKKVKPVVASMGDVAASGGYYLLVPADTILASPYTLTGSIGVIGILYNAQNFFNNKLGITQDIVKTNPYADFGSIFRPMTPIEEISLNNMLQVVYQDFIGHVADAREMSKEKVNEIGQGRVWLASDAVNINLIDNFGGLNNAIKIAASMAGLDKYRIEELPKLEEPVERLFKDVAEQVKINSLRKELGVIYSYYKELNDIFCAGTYQAIIPFNLNIN